jgi:S1-C subfamily serine protease
MAEVLSKLSDDLASTVARAGESILRVEARGRLGATGIVWSADGVIVTAHHVVEHEDNISVGLPKGESVPAALVGRDPTTDLAVLRAETTGLATPTWTEADNVKVGNLVLALGRPGKTVQATLGIVSAYGDSWRSPAGGRLDRYLQTDVVMYPGFSGGPLVDAAGNIVGLNTSALLRGISITVPAPTIGRVVETLLEHGKIRRGYLGVGAQPVRLPASLAQQLGQEAGLLLASVESNSPAESHGLLLGDTLVAIDGQPVRSLDELLTALSGDKVGTTVPVRFVRGGQGQELSITIGERA